MVQVTIVDDHLVRAVADVAARTFPLACPSAMPREDIAAFIATNLSEARFGAYVSDPERLVLAAVEDGEVVGYAMAVRGVPDDDVQRAVVDRPAVELSKMYAVPEAHGAGASAALMERVVAYAEASGARCIWLGVNQQNVRAQRFYAKHGFTVGGTKTFRVGRRVEDDFVMVRRTTLR
jgi:ribosomal protein S18 acetylase RimI-like enzyme